MLSMRIAMLVLLGCVLAACSDQSASRLLAPGASGISRDQLRANGAGRNSPFQAIEGHATFVPTTNLNGEQKYEVEADQKPNAPARGTFEYKGSSGGGFRIHGSIYCFTVAGNTARVSGRVEQSTNPNVSVGQYLIWTFVDNHQTHGQSDLTTELQRVDITVATAHCGTNAVNTGPFLPVQGNLQTRTEP